MNIKALIQRLLDEGKEKLSEGEIAELLAYKEPDTSALTNEIATLQAKLAASATDKDKSGAELAEIRAQMTELTKAVDTERKARQAAEAEAKSIKRSQTIDSIRTRNGIVFIDGIDPEITRAAFARAFDSMDDLTDEGKIAEAVEKFRKTNGGLIRAASGAGGNFGGTHGTPSSSSNVDAMAQTLTAAGILRASK